VQSWNPRQKALLAHAFTFSATRRAMLRDAWEDKPTLLLTRYGKTGLRSLDLGARGGMGQKGWM
jgi:hypothetical protein